MDCCNYGEYRGPGQYGGGGGGGAGAGWDGYGPYAPLPYTPYAHGYYAPPAHDAYARYYRYDYPAHHLHHVDHIMPMEYGAYASKETRVRRALARREQRAITPALHLPHATTPPLECGINGRGPGYCETQMWPHYQMGVLNGGGSWSGANAVGGTWTSRNTCSREHLRYTSDCRTMKGPHHYAQNQACIQDGRSTPYRPYDETPYNGENGVRHGNTPEFPAARAMPTDTARAMRDRFYTEPRRSPPDEKRPPVVPLPAFQQAFGSTEIGKFAEAFSRAEVALEDASGDNFSYETFSDWDATPEPQWSLQPTSREIKCEDNF